MSSWVLQAFDKHLPPKGSINCAGSKVLTSVEQYLDLMSDSLPGEAQVTPVSADLFPSGWRCFSVLKNLFFADVKAKAGNSPFLKCPSQFPVIVWHPYTRHHYFCAGSEKEQQKWQAVLQDCVRHSNDGESFRFSAAETPVTPDASTEGWLRLPTEWLCSPS